MILFDQFIVGKLISYGNQGLVYEVKKIDSKSNRKLAIKFGFDLNQQAEEIAI
jgi:hypothetical protein